MRWLEARHRDRNSPCLIEAHTAAGAFQRERAKQQQPQPWHNNLSSLALQARDMAAYQVAKVAAEDTTQRKDAAQRPAAEAALPIFLLPSPHQNNLITSLPNLVTHTNTFTLHNQMGGGGNKSTRPSCNSITAKTFMVAADPSLISSNKTPLLTSPKQVVQTLLATEGHQHPDSTPWVFGAEGEGGECTRSPSAM